MTDRSTILSMFWQVADILRGTLAFHEIAELPALFFFLKRLTDSAARNEKPNWLSQYPSVRKELGQFSWRKLSNDEKPNEALLWLLRKIEKSIPSLSGLSERSNLAHLAQREHVSGIQLRQIFDRLNAVSLGALSCNDVSEMFQQLLDGIADRAAGSSVTPTSVRKLLIELVEPKAGSSIYDPVCGYASLLCDAARAIKTTDARSSLFGQDLQLGVALIAKMNTLLGNWDSDIRVEDTLASPQHVVGDELKKFDVILANPPFGLRVQRDQVANDQFGRFKSVQPLLLEVGIIQHIAKSLADHGRGAVLVPNGFLFRGGSDYEVRKGLLETDRIHAVISLPAHLFAGTAIAASILVLNGPKRRDSKRRVTFVDLSAFADGQKTRRHISEKGIATAASCVGRPSNQEGISAVVQKEQLLANDYDLAVSRYVHLKATEQRSFGEELRLFVSALEDRDRAEHTALVLLNALTSKLQERPND